MLTARDTTASRWLAALASYSTPRDRGLTLPRRRLRRARRVPRCGCGTCHAPALQSHRAPLVGSALPAPRIAPLPFGRFTLPPPAPCLAALAGQGASGARENQNHPPAHLPNQPQTATPKANPTPPICGQAETATRLPTGPLFSSASYARQGADARLRRRAARALDPLRWQSGNPRAITLSNAYAVGQGNGWDTSNRCPTRFLLLQPRVRLGNSRAKPRKPNALNRLQNPND
jgi:hypothetical protein